MRARTRHAVLLAGAVYALGCAPALAAPNPSANILFPTPASCAAPGSAPCQNAVVAGLDSARAVLALPPYTLPADFDSLTAEDQLLILSNLDRSSYGLPAIAGLSPALDSAAQLGVSNDSDPDPDPVLPDGLDVEGWASNWAGGFANDLLAYYDWMYDDGPGSSNGDCRSPTDPGCWGHRQDVLSFASAGAIVMGAAAGVDSNGVPGYAMTIIATPQASTSWTTLSYTWSQALADIGGSPGNSGSGGGTGSGSGAASSGGSAGAGAGSGSGGSAGSATVGAASGTSSASTAASPGSAGATGGGAPGSGRATTSAGSSGAGGSGARSPQASSAAQITQASVDARSARFVLRSSGPASGFECALVRRGGGAPHYRACGFVRTYVGLAPGRYTFYARVAGAAGRGRRPVRRSFSIAG
jgi:hypothetical protein